MMGGIIGNKELFGEAEQVLDAKSTGSTSIFIPKKRFVVTRLIVLADVFDTVSGDPSISLGTNSTAYNNIIAATSLTGLNAEDEVQTLFPAINSGVPVVEAGTEIFTNISVAATATEYELLVKLIGAYFQDR